MVIIPRKNTFDSLKIWLYTSEQISLGDDQYCNIATALLTNKSDNFMMEGNPISDCLIPYSFSYFCSVSIYI